MKYVACLLSKNQKFGNICICLTFNELLKSGYKTNNDLKSAILTAVALLSSIIVHIKLSYV